MFLNSLVSLCAHTCNVFICVVELSSCSEDEYDSEDSEKDLR